MRPRWILLAVVVAAGCEVFDPRPAMRDFFYGVGDSSAPDPTEQIRKKEYKSWPKEIREAVDDRMVLVGMTKNQVQAALHLEEKVIQKSVLDGANGKTENWTVWRSHGWSYLNMHGFQMVTITFRDGAQITR